VKVTREKEQFKKLSAKDLESKVNFFKKELFGLRLNSLTTHIKDYSQFKKIKKNIARVLSYLNQKSLS